MTSPRIERAHIPVATPQQTRNAPRPIITVKRAPRIVPETQSAHMLAAAAVPSGGKLNIHSQGEARREMSNPQLNGRMRSYERKMLSENTDARFGVLLDTGTFGLDNPDAHR